MATYDKSVPVPATTDPATPFTLGAPVASWNPLPVTVNPNDPYVVGEPVSRTNRLPVQISGVFNPGEPISKTNRLPVATSGSQPEVPTALLPVVLAAIGALDLGGVVLPPADYIVTSVAEWNAVATLSGATLSGKTVELQGTNFPTQLLITNKTMTTPLVIRGAAGHKLVNLKMTSVQKVTLQNLDFQMTGWPKTYLACVELTGTNADLKYDGLKMRHGYGASLVDLTPAVLNTAPETVRTDNIITATTTSARVTVNRSPADGPTWAIEFFNRGANAVYIKGGDNTVVATTADTLVAAGAYYRLTLTTTTFTHVAVLAAAGTSECNARGEVGISTYLADAFSCFGGTTVAGMEIVNCEFFDISNAIKGFATTNTGRLDIWKNKFTRVYQDLVSIGSADPTCKVSIMLNEGQTPSAKSGIPENQDGDARDPHGDLHQTFYLANVRNTGGFFIAGNVYWFNGRSGSQAQGNFISDNDGGYEGVWSVANVLAGGSDRGYSIGDAGVTASGYVFGDGDTIVKPENAGGNTGIFIYGGTTQNNAFERTIANGFPLATQAKLADNILLTSGNSSIFANWAGVTSVTSKAEMLAALTTGQQVGAADLRASLINENAATPDDVIIWANTRHGLSWPMVTDLAASTLYTSPYRRVLGGGSGMAITAFAGTEYQVANDSAGTVVTQAWTTSPGVVSRGQFVQVQGTTSASPGGDAGLGVTIAGIATPLTALTLEEYFTVAGDMGFLDPAASSMNPTVGQVTFWAKLRDPALDGRAIFSLSSRVLALDIVSVTSGGDIRTQISDSANTLVKALSVPVVNVFQQNTVTEILWTIDMANSISRIWVNGVLAATETMSANTGRMGTTNSKMNFLQSITASNRYTGQVFGLAMWKGVAPADGVKPVAAPYWSLGGNAAAANASTWKSGTGTAT